MSDSQQPQGPPPVATMADLVERYEVLLFDAFGVLLRSDGPIEGAVSLVQALEAQGKPYFVLTNDASRTIETGCQAVPGDRVADRRPSRRDLRESARAVG